MGVNPRTRAGFRLAGGRLMQALATAWVIATLCFVFVHWLPGDTALNIAVARVGADRVNEEVAARIRSQEGLDGPLMAQYATWIGRVVALDLGKSLVSRKPVIEELTYHMGFTFGLGALGWLLSYVIALPLGIAAGLRPDGFIDRTSTGLCVLFASLPTFLVGIGLVSVFALTLRILPPAGFQTAAHMVLPAATLALGLAAFSVPVIRNAVVEVRSSLYFIFARVRGFAPAQAMRNHGVRNATIPVVTFAALQFAYVVDGFVVVETLFAYPGLGDLLVRALLARDVPVVMGAGLAIGLLYAIASACADLAALGLDPRRQTAGTAHV